MALSISIPSGSPLASFRIWPPAGAAVWAVMPANLSIAELTTTAWPSARLSTTGRSGAARSRSARVGKRFSGQWVSIQPAPEITSPPGLAAAQAFRRATRASTESVPSRLRVISRNPIPARWAWESTKPG